MKPLLTVLFALFFASHFSQAATIPTYDGFNYTAGFDLGTQADSPDSSVFQWTHIGVTGTRPDKITVGSENLSYPGLATSVGNSVTNKAGTITQGLRYESAGTNAYSAGIFYSAIFKINDLGSLGAAGAYILALNNTSTPNQTTDPTVIPGRTFVRKSPSDATKFNVGIAYTNGATPVIVWDNSANSNRNIGDPIFVVVKYVSGTGASMWINPDASTLEAGSPPAGNIDNNSAGSAPGTAIQSLLVVNQTTTVPSYTIDEVRLGLTWASVTPAGPAGFSSQPSSVTTNYGNTATFTAVAAGTGTITYQWKKNGSDLTDGATGSGSVIAGATTASLTITGVSQPDEGSYRLAATNSIGGSESTTATLTVNDPVITTQPGLSNPTPLPGATVNFTNAAAAGSPTLTYRWQKGGVDVANGTFGGATISGANTAALQIQGVRAGVGGDSGSYVLRVTNGFGRGVGSIPLVLTVNDPVIVTSPTNQTKNFNSSVTFTVTISGTAPPFTYQWKKNGVNINNGDLGGRAQVTPIGASGATTTTLTINNLVFGDGASAPGYSVVVTDNSASSATSAAATLSVVDPSITVAVASVITNAGSTAILKVQAASSGALTYIWKTNGVAVTDGATPWGSTISGATSDTLNISNVASNDAKAYAVEVSGPGPTQSSTGTLSVVTITRQTTPSSLVIATGGKAVFSVRANLTGTGTITYQWRKTGGDIAGETAAAIAITNAQSGDTDTYSVKVIYGPGSAFIQSDSASLTVSPSLQLSSANLVVARVGDGAQLLRDAGNSIYLDQYTPSGTYANTVTIPDFGSDAIIARGTASDTINSLSGMTTLTLSDNGGYLVLNGYRTNYDASATVIVGTAADPSGRAVTTVDPSGQYQVRVQALPADFGNSAYRSAAFDGVDEYWGASGSTTIGAYYFGTQVSPGGIAFNNARIVSRFNGKFYLCGANLGIFHFDGKPHPGDTLTQDITTSTAGGSGACDFAVSPDGNTIYIADGRNWSSTMALTNGGIQKWENTGTFGSAPTRVLKPDPNSNIGVLYLTVDFSGGNPVVYATTIGGSQNKLVKIVDDGSNSGAGTATILATAGADQQFRGIRFGPGAAGPILSQTIAGAGTTNGVVCWSSTSGTLYRLDYKDDLSLAGWSTLGTVTATGSTTCLTDTNSPVPAKRFYRVAIP